MSAGVYDRIKSLDQLKALVDKLIQTARPVSFDVETGYNGPDKKKGSLRIDCPDQFICGFSFTNDRRWSRYVPVAHELGDNLPEEQAWEVMQPLLETVPIVCHNWKFEARNLRRLDDKGRGPKIRLTYGGDTMLQAYVLQGCNRPDGQRVEFTTGLGLKALTKVIFDHDQAHIDSLFAGLKGAALERMRFSVLELSPEVIAYACEDTTWCLAIHELLEPQAIVERGQTYKIESGIVQLLVELEDWGLPVDWEGMEAERQKAIPFQQRMEKSVKSGLGALAGRDLTTLNLGSTKQLKELLYRDLGFSTTRLTAGAEKQLAAGKETWEVMSTDAVAMEGLSQKHPALKKVLEWREVGNGLARFSKWLDENHDSHDGRVHPNFGQTTVGTGRFAANDPPVQQMPKEWRWSTQQGIDVWGKGGADWRAHIEDPATQNHVDYWTGNFRDYVAAKPGHYLIGYDYSQIELRVLAGVSREPLLLEAFANGTDVHTLTAAMMLGKRVEDVDPKVDRPVGKTMNFALLYQMGPKSLAERLGITMDRANELYNAYFAQFASIRTWMERAKNEGMQHRETGQRYAETPFGRKYVVRELDSPSKAIQAKGMRVLINAPIQGGAADYMKIAMLRARKVLMDKGLWEDRVMMVHNLHDALVFEARDSVDPNWLREVLEPAVVFPVRGFPEIVADWELGQKHGSCAQWKPGMRAVHRDVWVLESLDEPISVVSSTPPTQTPVTTDLITAPQEPVAPAVPPAPSCEGTTAGFDETTAGFPDTAGAEVIVEMAAMPTEAQLNRFLDLVTQRPGKNRVTLKMPEGEVRIPAECGLGLADKGVLSMALGGAQVYHPKGSVDLDTLASGLSL